MTRTWIESARTWWLSTLRFPRARRRLFYQLAAAQLRGGTPPTAAFGAMVEGLAVDRVAATAARAVRRAVDEGRGVWEGLARVGGVPAEEIGVVRVAEEGGDLVGGLEDLAGSPSEGLGILRSVLAPNSYFLILLALGAFGVSQLGDFMVAARLDPAELASNRAYRLSDALATWGLPGAAAGAALMATVVAGRRYWRGAARALLGPFDREHRARATLEFAELAARLYGRGANHAEVLRGYEDAYGRTGFAAWAVRGARRDLAEGMEPEDAIRGRLATPGIVGVVKVMVPGGERGLYAAAWAEAANIQRTLLAARYGTAAGIVRWGTVSVIALMLAVVVPGMYAAYTGAGP